MKKKSRPIIYNPFLALCSVIALLFAIRVLNYSNDAEVAAAFAAASLILFMLSNIGTVFFEIFKYDDG